MSAPFLDRLEVTGFWLTIGCVVAAAALFGGWMAASLAIGGALSLANVVALRRSLASVIGSMQAEQPPRAAAYGTLLLKFLVVAAVVSILVGVLGVHAPAFAVGFSVVPVAVVFETMRGTPTSAPESSTTSAR